MTDGYMRFMDGEYRLLNLKAYYKNGTVKVISCDTSYTMYEPGGKVYSHCQMQDGVKNGNSFNYIDGLLMIRGHFKNGQRDGKQISYHMGSGKLASEENYANGKLDGPVKEYDTLGNISRKILYKNGSVIKATYFDSTGEIIGTTDGQEYDKNRKNVENFSKDATHQ
jgi:antitoxin component YwqK of YwqJK toxin-antitoxin module